MATATNYTTRQAASIGLQPGNLIGETHYITENQITPPIKQRVVSRKLLSTNISRCQCCCPPFASSLCRSCLCPCWAYLLIGLLLALLLAGLAVEIGLLSRERLLYRYRTCTQRFNLTVTINDTSGEPISSSTARSPLDCSGFSPTSGMETSSWSFFSYSFLVINLFVYFMKSSTYLFD